MKYYETIRQLPVSKYFEIVDSGELKPLIRSGRPRLWNKFQAFRKLHKIWYQMEVEITGIMMQDEEFVKDLLKRKNEIITLMEDSISDKKDPLTSIEAEAIRRLNAKNKEKEQPVHYMRSMVALETHLSTQIDKDKMSVEDYLHHMVALKESVKRQEKEINKMRNGKVK